MTKQEFLNNTPFKIKGSGYNGSPTYKYFLYEEKNYLTSDKKYTLFHPGYLLASKGCHKLCDVCDY